MALILLVSTGMASAGAGVVASLVPADAQATVGQPVVITATIETDGRELGSFSGRLTFDPAVLRYDSYTADMPGWMEVINATQAGAGIIYFVGANAQGQAGTVTPIVITFTPLQEGMALLDLNYTAMAEAHTYAAIAPSIQDGSLTIAAARITAPTSVTLRRFDARRGLFGWLR